MFVTVGLMLAMACPAAAQNEGGAASVRFASPQTPTEVTASTTQEAVPSIDPPANLTDDPAPQFLPQTPGQSPTPSVGRSANTTAPSTRRVGTPAPIYSGSSDDSKITGQTRRALSFYGGSAARRTLGEMPVRMPVHSLPRQPATPRSGKPFESRRDEPTVSPYLNLYRDEERGAAIPNYFTYVRPQLEQWEANRTHQHELQQLRGQLQSASAAAAPQFGARRSAAQFMDTGQFYRVQPR
jgi:hypothetical protein